MVAITVILAAVIGTFVLGLGDQVQSTTPQAQFGFDQGTDTIAGVEVKTVTVTHEAGDTIDSADISLKVNGETAYGADSTPAATSLFDSGDISAGSSATIVAATNDEKVNAGNDYADGSDGLDVLDDDSATVENVDLSGGDTVRVIYDSPDSDSSSTIGKYEVQ